MNDNQKKRKICFCFNNQHQCNVSGFVCLFVYKESRHGQKKEEKKQKTELDHLFT